MHRLNWSVESLVVLLVVAIANTTAAIAAVPAAITVQGRLTDASGNPISGPQNFTFKIFDASVGGTIVWPGGGGENQSLNSDAGGLWIGMVGAVSPLTDSVFADTSRWLEITVAGTTLPRVRLVTGPFAYRTSTVDGAAGGTITAPLTIGASNSIGIGSLAVGAMNSVGNNSLVAGSSNTTIGWNCSIAGGQSNYAGDLSCAIGGGQEDTVTGQWCYVGGGRRNVVAGEAAFIGGGFANRSTGPHNTIAGGYQNVARLLAEKSTIGGGGFNLALGGFATIGGGLYDTASGAYSTVGGGNANHALSVGSTVSGGTENFAQGARATVVGGAFNLAKGLWSVAGGHGSRAIGWNSVAFGGGSDVADSNVASGDGSVVPGGIRNRAAGNVSFAAGNRARAMHHGSFVWSDNAGTDFSSTANNQFLVRASGGVGIGTNNPQAPLQLGDVGTLSLGLMRMETRGTTGAYRSWDVGVAGGGADVTGKNYSFSIDDRALGTNPELIVKWGTGNVGIGEPNPTYKLQVVEPGNAGLRVQTNSAGGAVASFGGNGEFQIDAVNLVGGRLTIKENGNVGIGYNNSGYKLGVNGNMWVQTNLEVGGNSVMYNALTVWGGIYGLNGCQVQWSCPSDVRLKKNIEPIVNALDAIDQLHGVRYDWRREEYPERDFSQRRQIGLIAQDVQKVAPEVVTTDKSGYLGVDYEKLVPLLIEGMKEQQQRIEKLEETIRRMQP